MTLHQALASAAAYETAEGDSCGEASMLLMRARLMDPNVWGSGHQPHDKMRCMRRQDDMQDLKSMGFRYVLSPQVLISPHVATASRRQSHRARAPLVSAFEDSLQV